MSETDSFIQEVSEEVRRDRMFSVWKRYGPFLIGAIVLIVVGAAARGWWDARVDAKQQALGGAMIAAGAADDPAEAAKAFGEIVKTGEYGVPVLARLREAAALGQAGDREAAMEAYTAISQDADVDPRIASLAEFRMIMLGSETMPADEQLNRLAPLTAPDSPWRLAALEFTAAAQLRTGDADAARATLETIAAEESAPPATVARAREMIAALTPAAVDAAPAEEDAAPDTEDLADKPPSPAPDETDASATERQTGTGDPE